MSRREGRKEGEEIERDQLTKTNSPDGAAAELLTSSRDVIDGAAGLRCIHCPRADKTYDNDLTSVQESVGDKYPLLNCTS